MDNEHGENYQMLRVRQGREGFLLFYSVEKCLYRRSGKPKNGYQYFSCITSGCKSTGKVQERCFERISKRTTIRHNHPNHEGEMNRLVFMDSAKTAVVEDPRAIEDIVNDLLKG